MELKPQVAVVAKTKTFEHLYMEDFSDVVHISVVVNHHRGFGERDLMV